MISPETLALSELPFVLMQNKSQLPKEPAIYFAIDSFGCVQYIGKSINPKSRWVCHPHQKKLAQLGEIKIAYLYAEEVMLDAIEIPLIQWFKPPLNKLILTLDHLVKRKERSGSITVRQVKDVEAPNLGVRIKEARIFMSNRKSLEQICDEVGVSRTYWYDIETERIRGALSIENLRKIEQVLEINLGISFDD